jgi:tetratricopeptide (TPR) repeat protein
MHSTTSHTAATALRFSRSGWGSVGLLVGLCMGLFAGCVSDGQDLPRLPEGAEAVSLLGDTLYAGELPADVLDERTQQLAAARAAYEADPDDADAIIWLGRRTAYLSHYREAIEIYTEGIAKHPDDPRMYRHRGHRFISTRQLDRAIDDFQRAAELIAGDDDEIEPDGQPNARNIPTSTLQSNIWYHLGLARYLQGDFEGALGAYRMCMEVSRNPDMLVATSHWLYMTLRRLEADAGAADVLEPIRADLDVIENHSYHRLLLMYKGELEPEGLWGSEADALGDATVGYGIGNWHLYSGRPEEAEQVFRRVLETGSWASFGYLAAEAELSRLGG